MDVVLVALVLYQILRLVKHTRAFQILRGVALLLVLTGLTNLLGFTTISWLLNQVVYVSSIAVIVIFQPELRKALERIGRGRSAKSGSYFKNGQSGMSNSAAKIVEEFSEALLNLSARKIGALIVMEGKIGLQDHIGTGTRLDADISAALLEQIFEPNTPLHDGAVIINNDKIVSAGCFLPLSDDFSISRELGTRHRAALGISEISDSTTFIVSEETGTISIAREGKLERGLNKSDIEEILAGQYSDDNADGGFFSNLWKGIKDR